MPGHISTLGSPLAQMGRYDQAVPYFQEAIRLDPQNVGAHFDMANALYKKGRRRCHAQNRTTLTGSAPPLGALQSRRSVARARTGKLGAPGAVPCRQRAAPAGVARPVSSPRGKCSCRRVNILPLDGQPVSDLPLPIFMDQRPVRVDRAAPGFGAHVADHVPMQGALILTAGLGVRVP